MRFMIMHKMTEEMEKGLPPDPEIIEGVGKLIGEGLNEKLFISGEGLKPSAERVHIAYKKGKRTITQGPFRDPKELIAGFLLMSVRSRDEAIAWCDKLAAAKGDVELFLGPVVETWDLGMEPKPENPPLRFLSMYMADARSESDEPQDKAAAARIAALVEEMTKAGVLQVSGALASTKRGARMHFKGGKATVTDGPFAESKELIAGYAIVDLPSRAEAVRWAIRFGEVVKVNEIDLRQMSEE